MKTLTHWSVEDYHRMIAAGILADRAVELWAGEIVEMSPETPIHYNTAKRGARYLEQLLAGRAEVRFNGPITLSNSEPEPDIAIVRLPESAYDTRHPRAEDIFWLIEVAKTSFKQDLEIKSRIYATAGIQEYWIVDLSTQTLRVLRDPEGDGYQSQTEYEGGVIVPLAFPERAIALSAFLPT